MRICEPPPQLRSSKQTRLTDEEEPGYEIPHSCVTLQILRTVCGWASLRKRGQLISPQYNSSSAKNDDTMDPIRVCNVGFYCDWGLSRSSVVTRWVVGGTDWDTYPLCCYCCCSHNKDNRVSIHTSTSYFILNPQQKHRQQQRLLSCPMCCLV